MSSAVWASMLSGHCSLVANFWISVIFLRTAAASVGRRRERTDSLISWRVAGSVSLSTEQTDRQRQKRERGKVGVQMQGRTRADIQPCTLSRTQSLHFRQLPGSALNLIPLNSMYFSFTSAKLSGKDRNDTFNLAARTPWLSPGHSQVDLTEQMGLCFKTSLFLFHKWKLINLRNQKQAEPKGQQPSD